MKELLELGSDAHSSLFISTCFKKRQYLDGEVCFFPLKATFLVKFWRMSPECGS